MSLKRLAVDDLDDALDFDGGDAEKFYSEDQPRDENGRWTDGGSGGGEQRGEQREARVRTSKNPYQREGRSARIRELSNKKSTTWEERKELGDLKWLEKAERRHLDPETGEHLDPAKRAAEEARENAKEGRAYYERAVGEYQQNSYEQVNDYLRGGHTWTGEAREDGKKLADQIAYGFTDPKLYQTFEKETTLYRGIENYGVHQRMSALRVGAVVQDKAFVSTSLSEDIAQHAAGGFSPRNPSVMLELTAPKGLKFVTGHRRDEKERLLQNGTRFKITKIERYKGNKERDEGPTLRIYGRLLKA